MMKKFLLMTGALLIGTSALFGEADNGDDSKFWISDCSTARKRAAAEKKKVLLFFTGSDWCGFCIKMNHEVWQQQECTSQIAKSFVPVKIDFPKRKKLALEDRSANEALARQYQVHGFPTVIVTDAGGKVLGRSVGFRDRTCFMDFLKSYGK